MTGLVKFIGTCQGLLERAMVKTDTLPSPRGGILLYLPWINFDMLGGVDVVVDRLWNGFEKMYPGRAIIGLQDWEDHGDKIDDQGRRFLHLNLPAPPSVEDRLPLRYQVTLVRRLPEVLCDLWIRNIATVNFHFPALNVYPLALLKKFGLWRGRIVLSFHGSDVNEIVPGSSRWKFIAEQTDTITACSFALARRIDDLGLFHQPASVVYNGIDGERFLKERDTSPLPVARPYILNVGNYVPGKAQDVLLKAFAQVALKCPELKLVCVGGTLDGAWLSHLNELADRLNLQNRVLFLENQPQRKVASLMCNAVCLAHASNKESFGLVLIEAGVCGAPIIATRVGGIPEIIPSDEFGLLFENGDVDELANAISAVMQSPEQAKTRAAKFYERVARVFSTEAMLEGYWRVLQGVPEARSQTVTKP